MGRLFLMLALIALLLAGAYKPQAQPVFFSMLFPQLVWWNDTPEEAKSEMLGEAVPL